MHKHKNKVLFFLWVLLSTSGWTQKIIDLSLFNISYNNATESYAKAGGVVFNTKNRSTKNNQFIGLGYAYRKIVSHSYMDELGFKSELRLNISENGTHNYNASHTIATTQPSFERVKQLGALSVSIAGYKTLHTGTKTYLQTGVLVGRWRFEGQYFNHYRKKQKTNVGGFMGGGIETHLSDNLFLNLGVNYEIYRTIKGRYTTFARWSVTPHILRINASVRHRF